MPKPITLESRHHAAPPPNTEGASIIAGRPSPPPHAEVGRAGLLFRAFNPGKGVELDKRYFCALDADVDAAAAAAWEAYFSLLERPHADRARLLDTVAARVSGLGDALIETAADETGLGPARLVAERERALATIRMFSDLLRAGDWLHAAIDTAEPSRRPLPKPDIRRTMRPLGPVAVMGPCCYPLAYGTIGSDTASALAAGCPVVVKGHPLHPGTCELLARAVCEAVRDCGFHPGTFSMLHSGGRRELHVGQRLAQHPCIRAVGYAGSREGGLTIAKLAAQRGDPIPAYAQMGAANPVFVLPEAVASDGEVIAQRLFSSIVNANGQVCTRPGVIFVARGGETERFVRALADAMNKAEPQAMLGHPVRRRYTQRLAEITALKGVEVRGGSPQGGHERSERTASDRGIPIRASAVLLRTTLDVFNDEPALHQEIFGPAAVLVVCNDQSQLPAAAASVQAGLAGTIFSAPADDAMARRICTILEQRVGRIVFNSAPTGVEVCPSIVHGGPYPAAIPAWATSHGPEAIARWARPVCYQNAPESILPAELRNANPLDIERLVNSRRTPQQITPKRPPPAKAA